MSKSLGLGCRRAVYAGAALFMIVSSASGQLPGRAKNTQKAVETVASKGFSLPATATVNANVSVQAVLLPSRVAKRVFGAEIANNYAAIELTISNRSHDAALIIHSVYIDYRNWLLSGNPSALVSAGLSNAKDMPGDSLPRPCNPQGSSPDNRPGDETSSLSDKTLGIARGGVADPGCESWEAGTKPGEVASVEYRVARGELLDEQPWTFRNLAIGGLQALGTIASGYGFAFKETGIAKGISSYNGSFLPAARTLFPDDTIAQLDRISDFGFRTNKVIGKESSEIVVAFFPIDRFLTPTLKKIFLKSPAAFFMPVGALADPISRKAIMPVLQNVLTATAFASIESHTLDATTMRIFDGISLNKVQVVVGGIMAVDVDTIPPRIDNVAFDDSKAWSAASGDVTGTITGAFLQGGTVSIVNAGDVGSPSIATVNDGSTNEALHFRLTLSKKVPGGVQLKFRVTKQKNNISVTSNDYSITPPTSSSDAGQGTDTGGKNDKQPAGGKAQ